MADSLRDQHPLEPVLKDAEDELRRRLREACEAEERGVASESTQEIRQLEDALLAAAVAAQQTILVRRRMARHAGAEPDDRPLGARAAERRRGVWRESRPTAESETPETPETPAAAVEPGAGEPSTIVREFTDEAGRTWRAWQVTPRLARPGSSGKRILGDFQEGWICFEAADSTARRRLAAQQPRWAELVEEELRALLRSASNAPIRHRPGPTDAPEVAS